MWDVPIPQMRGMSLLMQHGSLGMLQLYRVGNYL
jgi:hypothetical protein